DRPRPGWPSRPRALAWRARGHRRPTARSRAAWRSRESTCRVHNPSAALRTTVGPADESRSAVAHAPGLALPGDLAHVDQPGERLADLQGSAADPGGDLRRLDRPLRLLDDREHRCVVGLAAFGCPGVDGLGLDLGLVGLDLPGLLLE